MSEIYEKGTAAERAAFEDHQRLARATTIPPTPGAPVRQFASDEERYAFMDASDAAHAQRIRDVRAARSGVAPAAPTPPPAVARPTPPPAEAPNYMTQNIPTIASTLTPAAQGTDADIEYRPAAGRGASVNTSENTVTVHSVDARSEHAVAASHIDVPTMDLAAAGRALAASVKVAEDRLAAATDHVSKQQAQVQLDRALASAAFHMQRLESIALARGSR